MILKKEYRLAIYRNYIVNVVVADTIQEGADKYLKGSGMSCDNTDGMFAYNNADHFISYIFITPASQLGSVSHECFHATCKVMNDIGANLDDSSEESYAYLLSYLVDRCEDTVDAYMKKRDLENQCEDK